MLSGTNNFNETSALGLGVRHEAPQGSSLDALVAARLHGLFFRRASSRQRRARPSAGDGEHADVDGRPLYGPLPDDWRSRGTLGTPRQHGPSASGLGHELTSGHGE